MTLTIRAATPGDVTPLGRMGAALMRFHRALDERRFLDVEDAEKGYAWWLGKELQNPRARILVAESNGAVVGYAYAVHEERDWNALRDACVVLHDAWVDEGHRKGGAARMLLDGIKAWNAEVGSPRVVLHTATGNTRAQALFAAAGFRPVMTEMAWEAEAVTR